MTRLSDYRKCIPEAKVESIVGWCWLFGVTVWSLNCLLFSQFLQVCIALWIDPVLFKVWAKVWQISHCRGYEKQRAIQREHISTQSNTATHRQPVIPLLNGFNGLCKHAAPCLLTHWTTKLCSGNFPGMIGSECSQIRTSIGSLEVREPTSLGST